MERMPIQIILSVKINDAFAITWGCENNEQNTEVLKFFTKKSVEAISKEMKREDEARGIAEIIFSTM